MMSLSKRQAMTAELISDGCNVLQTFDSCRQLIALCMAMDNDSGDNDAKMGEIRVLRMVNDALAHLESEVRILLKADKQEVQS